MPYYSAGDYYRGDYYRGGDNYAAGGLFGSLGKVLGKVAGTALSLVPAGRVAKSLVSAAVPFISGKPRKVSGPNGPLVVPVPGLRGLGQRITPGGATGLMVEGGFGRARRMNVTNVKALRRAGRRVKGFLKLARRLGALPVGGSGRKLFKLRRKKR